MLHYKFLVSTPTVYKEIQLPSDEISCKIGTEADDRFRFHEEDFEEAFELVMERGDNGWQVMAAKNIFLNAGDARKLVVLDLKQGMTFTVHSKTTNDEMMKVSFLIDFDHEAKEYDSVIDISNIQRLSMGAAPDCDIVLLDGFSGSDRITMTNMGNEIELNIQAPMYGISINGIQTSKTCRVRNTDFFSIAHFGFYYRDKKLYIANSDHLMIHNISVEKLKESESALQYPFFNRSTQCEMELPEGSIEILDPPVKPQEPEKNLLQSLIPSLASLALVVVFRGMLSNNGSFAMVAVSAGTMAIGIGSSIYSFINLGKKYRMELQDRIDVYKKYIEKKRMEIIEARNQEVQMLNARFINERETYYLAEKFSGHLFDRTASNSTYLCIRLGLGKKRAVREIKINERKSLTSGDALEQMPELLVHEFEMIDGVPVICDLKKVGNLGIVGDQDAKYSLLKAMTLDLVVHHYFKEVKLFFFMREERARQMEWIRFLPHIRNEDIGTRNVICDEESKTIQFEYLYKELSRREALGKEVPYQALVIFLVDSMGIGTHPVSRFLKEAPEYNVYFISFEDHAEKLLMYCGALIETRKHGSGRMIFVKNTNISEEFTFVIPKDDDMHQLARKLAPVRCEEISLESRLTKSITLFEMMNVYMVEDLNLQRNWSRYDVIKSMAAEIGVDSKNERILLDIHEKADGPHGLVAGTTGSGKSELLQTYILSMSIRYSPEEVAFVLIDFKGGGMANQFRNLPHLLGAITDIDGKEINRSLLSIRAEIEKRKELFAAADVNSINGYITKYRNKQVNVALPHLIIIVDEFAELKAEQPEFMKELISASRIGRSLGVHLILATQKPAGQISDQIWSNSRFKICLKVQTKEDSNEVIKSPLAAEIIEPGRAYLQVGNNEVFELFQSAFSGASEIVNDDKIGNREYKISKVALSGKRTVIFEQKKEKRNENGKTQLEALVDYIRKFCVEENIKKLQDICLPPLPEILLFSSEYEKNKNGIGVGIGIYDAPSSQYQGVVDLGITGENSLIIGSSQYGKTNLLQVILRSLAESYTPEEVNIYILDFASMFLKNFENLPHIGGVCCADEEERIKNLFKMLRKEINVRRDKMSSCGVTSYAAYREAGYSDFPQIVLMIDNYTALKETYLGDDDLLLPVCREGASVGVSVIITNSLTAGMGYRYFSTIANFIAFQCNDADEYSTLFGYTKERPAPVPGRCLLMIHKMIYEAQTYLAFEGGREIDRSESIKAFIARQKEVCGNLIAKKIPSVPGVLSLHDLYEQGRDRDKREMILTGLDYESILPVELRFDTQFLLGMVGKNRDAQKKYLDMMMEDFCGYVFERRIEMYFIDNVQKRYGKYADMPFMCKYSTHPEDICSIIEVLSEEMKSRDAKVEVSGMEILSEFPVEVVIVNHKKAVDSLAASKKHIELFKEIQKNYRNWRIFFLFADLDDVSVGFNSPEILKVIRDEKKGLIFGPVKEVKLFEIPTALSRRFSGEVQESDAFWFNENELMRMKLIGVV